MRALSLSRPRPSSPLSEVDELMFDEGLLHAAASTSSRACTATQQRCAGSSARTTFSPSTSTSLSLCNALAEYLPASYVRRASERRLILLLTSLRREREARERLEAGASLALPMLDWLEAELPEPLPTLLVGAYADVLREAL